MLPTAIGSVFPHGDRRRQPISAPDYITRNALMEEFFLDFSENPHRLRSVLPPRCFGGPTKCKPSYTTVRFQQDDRL